ncbi:GTPase Era [[Mycoplasma] falconis]|uniref:GTPase Era n=1 Tax=[Mycoplasma] falconis TaxID=92403 RepID=A0A501XB37_9BACT|nr:GTPase Era [[Mycoplasma] falconis]TPE57780.1 GTPase Era [[Mycoplasma] falconis]
MNKEKNICVVGLIGRPNVGKSTLMNGLVDYNVAIVTSVPQTTRDEIKGIYNDEDSQIIFLDCPGIHKEYNLLSKKLNEKTQQVIQEAELILFLTPANEKIGNGDNYIIEKLKSLNVKNKIAVITKVDLIRNKENLEKKVSYLKDLGFDLVMGVGLNMPTTYKDLIEEIKKYSHKDIPLYDEDEVTDVSMRFIAKEIIREAAIPKLRDEIPHSIAVEIEDFKEEFDNYGEDLFRIYATIYTKRESQKSIIVGKAGSMIKNISTEARKKMELDWGVKVFLNVRVKVDEDWVENEVKIKRYGY